MGIIARSSRSYFPSKARRLGRCVVRFPLRFPYTFHVLAAFIVFLGVSAVVVMSEDIFPEIGIPVMSVICAIRGAIPAGIQPSTWRRPW
jgi:hypothetical protein